MSLQLTVMSLDFDALSTPTTRKFRKNQITVGRSTRNDLVLEGDEVSVRHAQLRLVRNGDQTQPTLYITDLGSTNGTHVKNMRLAPKEEVRVSLNERIRIGNFLIKPSIVLDEMGDVAENESDHVEKAVGEGKILRIVDSSVLSIPRPVEAKERGAGQYRGRVGNDLPQEINFIATPVFAVQGQVLHKGSAMADVQIDAGGLGTTTTNEGGRFTFADVPEGTAYSLRAIKASFVFTSESSSGVLAGDAQITFSATQLFTVRGTITYRGQPLAGAEVDAGKLGKTVTAADGNYVFPDVPEDSEISIQVSKAGFIIELAA